MSRAVRSGRVPWDHFVAESLAAIQRVEGGARPLGAFLSTIDSSSTAPSRPERSDGPLAGVPVAVKDNLVTMDLPTTCGSRLLEGYRSPFEATAVRRLREAGAAVVGETNMDEFGMGSSTEHSAFGPTRNPHDRNRVSGGSSGGSAAAVAAGSVPAALGSDTGRSVRQPASLCGVVGIKPTYGRVSRYGLVAFASSLDQVGTLGRTVEDAAALLEVISGHDPRDATSWPGGPLLLPAADTAAPLDDLVVGVPGEFLPDSLDESVRRLCREALGRLAERGARLKTINLPSSRYAIPTYYVLAPAEASSNLARFDGIRYGRRWGETSNIRDLFSETRS